MDMNKLLNEAAASVAKAASAVSGPETSPTPAPLNPTLSSASTAAIPTPNAFQPPVPNTVDFSSVAAEDEDYSDEEFDEDNPEWAKWNCNQIRTKIRNFIGTKEMTQSAFLKLCDINSNSYYRFMNLKGPYSGADNQTYEGAAIFFYHRERDEKKKKAEQKAANAAMSRADKKRKATEERAEKAKKAKKSKDGDDLLKRIVEIQFFLGEKLTTKAAFLRALDNIQANSLRSFVNLKRGAGSGAANVVYRKAYVFFEKKRILEGKKKTKKRLENEAEQARNGFPLRHDNGMRLVFVGKRM
ncbi:hypothetical protein PHYBOEH_010538 [Phytophthora boehmeriae]|uniref:DUF7726 domain-containing protein n=1 Tax=Phytophthora boehmeriae TaxID=109152 RepID=A0A8T1VPY9_9STRA|nr:hypothetical protein PHYBOEH_010538 [Phytophthora boehmeriae]